MRNRPALLSFLVLAVIGTVWGLTIPLGKIAVSTGHAAMGLTAWQLVLSTVFLAPVLWLRGETIVLSAAHLRYYFTIALIGTLVPNSLFFISASHLPGGVLAIVYATVPMFALGIALMLGNERFAWHRTFGIVLGVAAMVLLAVPDASLPDPDAWPFVVVIAFAALCYGAEGNYIALRAPRDVGPLGVLFCASALGACIAAPLAIAAGWWIDLTEPWGAPEWALVGSSAGHVVAYAGYMWLVGFAGVVFSAQVSYIVTLAAVAASMAMLGESYAHTVWLAIAMIFGGLMLVQPVGKLPEGEAA